MSRAALSAMAPERGFRGARSPRARSACAERGGRCSNRQAVMTNDQVFQVDVSKIKHWKNNSENLKDLFEAYVNLNAAIVYERRRVERVDAPPARRRDGAATKR